MKREKKKTMRWLSAFMVFCLILSYSGVTAFADTDYSLGMYKIKDKGVTDEMSARPEALEQGQIWTEKKMDYQGGDVYFEVTLFAWGKQFSDGGNLVNPLDPKSPFVTITDQLGDFEFVGLESAMPEGATFEQSNGSVIWTVPQDIILDEGVSIKYTVKLKDGWGANVRYETGEAEASFLPVMGNPYYWDEKDVNMGSFEPRMSWNAGNGLNEGVITDDVTGIVLIFGASNNCNTEVKNAKTPEEARALLFTYPGSGAGWGTATVPNSSDTYKWHLVWLKGDTYVFTVQGLEDGNDVIFEILCPNNQPGGNEAIPGTRVVLTNQDFSQKTGVGWVSDKSGVKTGLPVKGYVELAKNVASLKIIKEDASGKISPATEFQINVAFSGAGVDRLSDYKGAVRDETGTSYAITLKTGEDFTFDGLPVGIGYQVTEAGLPYDYRQPMPQTGTVSEDGNTVEVVNYRNTADLTVLKDVVTLDKNGKIIKDSDGKAYIAGDLLVYRITMENTGELSLRHVKWVENEGFSGPYRTYQDAQDGNAFTPRSGGYRLGAGGSMEVFYTYMVPADGGNPGVDNTVTASGTDPGGNSVEGSASNDVVFEHPDLSITKKIIAGKNNFVDSYTFEDGDTALFLVRVTNNGDVAASNVSLNDSWSGDGAPVLVSTNPADTNPGSFSVGAKGAVEFTYEAQLRGMTFSDMQALFNGEIDRLNGIIDDNETFIDETAPGMQEEAWNELLAAFSGYVDEPQDRSDISKALRTLSSDLANYDGEDDGPGYDQSDIDALQGALDAYDQVMDAYGAAAVGKAEAAKEKASADIADLMENGLKYDQTLTYESNTATIGSYAYGSPSDSVDVIVKPENAANINIDKYVRLSEDDDWQKNVVMDSGGGTAYYRVVISNMGTTVETMTLTDVQRPGWEKTITLGPGGAQEETYELAVPPNSDHYLANYVMNTANIAFGVETDEQDMKSSTLVTVLPKPFAELSIDKKVSLDGRRWTSGLSLFSDGPVDAVYRVRVMNIGTETAVFSLADDKYSGAFYTDPACTSEYGGDLSGITLNPMEKLTLYYKLELTGSTVNTVTYNITSGNEKTGKGSGSGKANVVIDPVPKVNVTLKKEVVTENEFNSATGAVQLSKLNWRDSAQAVNKYGTGVFWFRVTLKNDGNYPAEVKLSDVMDSGGVKYDFGDALTNAGLLTDADEYIALNPGGVQMFYVKAEINTPEGTDNIGYTNVVSIDDIQSDMPEGYEPVYNESDSAKVSVIKTDLPVIGLEISKQVKDSDGNWSDFASFTGTSADAEFRIILTAKWNPEDEISGFAIHGNVTDELDGAPLPDGFNGSFVLTDAAPQYTIAYTARLDEGAHVNSAVIDAGFEYDDTEYAVSAPAVSAEAGADVTGVTESAAVSDAVNYAVSDDNNGGNNSGGGRNGGGGNSGSPEGAPLTILQQDIPLALKPEQNVVIPEDETPLGDIPQTGVGDMGFSLTMLGLSLTALMAMAVIGRRGKN